MIGPVKNHRPEQVTVTIDELVPPDHFLRTVDALIEAGFPDSRHAKNQKMALLLARRA